MSADTSSQDSPQHVDAEPVSREQFRELYRALTPEGRQLAWALVEALSEQETAGGEA